ncbi:GL18274 [Drosophila persimilis]|uniref:GL18274 n=1 Tax=Drosophila persimilis TaxID=7234 RepID=B4H4P3_DROPE|nr:GL18274 [Drosophila persimilis]
MYLPTNTSMYEFLIVVLVFLLLLMNALATFVPRYTVRNTKRKCKKDSDSDQETYLGQAGGHTRLSNHFTGLVLAAGGRNEGEPSLYQDHYDV